MLPHSATGKRTISVAAGRAHTRMINAGVVIAILVLTVPTVPACGPFAFLLFVCGFLLFSLLFCVFMCFVLLLFVFCLLLEIFSVFSLLLFAPY